MAGIGFELRKVISKGGLTNVFNAALSGIMIVAGPWLMTILTIFVIRMFFDSMQLANSGLFQAAIVYSYAFSLSLFSGVHYLFTRLIADLLWENQQRIAAAWLIYFVIGTALAAAIICAVPLSFVSLGDLANPWLFRIGMTVLFVAVNLLWLLMLYISLLKWYVQIMLVYVLGMGSAIGLVVWWGKLWGIGAAVMGFGVGHLIIVAALAVMSFIAHPPKRPEKRKNILRTYFRKYLLLILSGFLFYFGQWADKFFYWFTRGLGIEGSFFRLFDGYDLPVYLAGLSIIPGLVYFVIFAETAFYVSLQKFMHSLTKEPYALIQQAKYQLIQVMKHELRDLAMFQAMFTGLAMLLAMWFLPDPAIRNTTIMALAGAYFQLMLMTTLNFLYYFELYKQAFVGALAFFGLNGLFFPIVTLLWPALPVGSGFFVSAVVALIGSYIMLAVAVRTLDRRIFLKAML